MTSIDPLPRDTAAPDARRATALRNVSHGANDLYWFILPPVLPLILQEFGLRYAAAGGMITAFLTVTAIGSLLMGRLSDRLHRTRLIGFGFILASTALWAGTLMPHLPLVIGFLLVGAVGVSTYHPAAYASIHDSGQGRGSVYGAFEASGSLALVLMLSVQGLLVGLIGWRGVIAVGAVPGALAGLALLLLPGAFLGGVAPRASAPRPSPGAAASGVAASSVVASQAGASAPGMLVPAMFVVGVMLRVLGVNALQNFVPTYLVRAVGMEPGIATLAMGFTFVGGLAGALIMGRAADRRGNFPIYIAASGLLIPLLPLMGLRLPIAAYPVLLVAIGFFNSACFPSQIMILAELTGERGKGSVFGVLMGMMGLTAAVSPLLFGLLADSAGLVTAVQACAIPVAVGWVVTLAVRRVLRLR